MIRIGIECHALESNRWGVGHHLAKLLEEISIKSELANEFRFYLYFKGHIPSDPYLNNPIFVKRVLKLPIIGPSFNIFYQFYASGIFNWQVFSGNDQRRPLRIYSGPTAFQI